MLFHGDLKTRFHCHYESSIRLTSAQVCSVSHNITILLLLFGSRLTATYLRIGRMAICLVIIITSLGQPVRIERQRTYIVKVQILLEQ